MISAEAQKIAVCDTSPRSGNPVLQKRWVLNKSITHRATLVGGCFPKQLRCQTALGNLVLCFATSRRISPEVCPAQTHLQTLLHLVPIPSRNAGRMSCRQVQGHDPGSPQVTFILMLKPPSCPLHSREGGFVPNNQGSGWHKRSSGLSQRFGATPCPTDCWKKWLRVPSASLDHLRSRTRPSRGWESTHGWESLQGQSCKRSLMEQKYSRQRAWSISTFTSWSFPVPVAFYLPSFPPCFHSSAVPEM